MRLYFERYNNVFPPQMIDHHELMITAIEMQDADLAERLARKHTTEMQNSFLKYLGSRQTSDISVAFL